MTWYDMVLHLTTCNKGLLRGVLDLASGHTWHEYGFCHSAQLCDFTRVAARVAEPDGCHEFRGCSLYSRQHGSNFLTCPFTRILALFTWVRMGQDSRQSSRVPCPAGRITQESSLFSARCALPPIDLSLTRMLSLAV